MIKHFTRTLLLAIAITPTAFASTAFAAEPATKPATSAEDKKQEFVDQLNSMCLTQTNKFLTMVQGHGIPTQDKLDPQNVCSCVEIKLRSDKYLSGFYSKDKSNPLRGYDKLKFKQYMGARQTAFLMACLAPELEKISADLSPL